MNAKQLVEFAADLRLDVPGAKLALLVAVEGFESAEITRLRAEVEALKLQGAAAELVHRETATTVLVQMAEVEALRADAERWRYINTRNNVWRRHNTAGEEHSALCVILPYGADLSCRATREIAIDAARAAQGCEHAPSL